MKDGQSLAVTMPNAGGTSDLKEYAMNYRPLWCLENLEETCTKDAPKGAEHRVSCVREISCIFPWKGYRLAIGKSI